MKKGKASLLVLVGVIALVAKPRRGAYGGKRYMMVTGEGPKNDDPQAAIQCNVTELNKKGKAKGDHFFWAQHQQAGWVALHAKIKCIEFLGDGVVEFSGHVVWGPAPATNDCSDYFTIRVVDGGPDGTDAAACYMPSCEASGRLAAGSSCNPCGCQPCPETTMSARFPAEAGDIVVIE